MVKHAEHFKRSDRGGVTAEFAITLPAVLLVLAFTISALSHTSNKIAVTSFAYDIARLEARGDEEVAAQISAKLGQGTRVSRWEKEGLLCVEIEQPAKAATFNFFAILSVGCAAVNK